MTISIEHLHALRAAIADIPADVSNDAVGANVARVEDIYAPETHAAALDPAAPIVLGARGTGKSFWSSVLGQPDTRAEADRAYPRLGLSQIEVAFGYTGIGGPDGIAADALDQSVPPDASFADAKAFWWATILSAIARPRPGPARPQRFLEQARNPEQREDLLYEHEQRLRNDDKRLLVVYDALDTVARSWPRRRLLTEALLEVVWAMRAYRTIRLKLFLRPDQLEDDALRFVELPKLKAGAVRLDWSARDLYGLLYARLAMTEDKRARMAFKQALAELGLTAVDRRRVLARRWSLATETQDQERLMALLAGPYMGKGAYAYKKGKTYRWPIAHLADAFNEVTPRSFLGMMIAAAKYGPPPEHRVITPDGIRHGLRAASRTRVDELHFEFPWIKGVLAPMAGLLLPKPEEEVFQVWQTAGTIRRLREEAAQGQYLSPFADDDGGSPRALFEALERIGVMFRRGDDRLDMPDLFRVAARLLKKGGVAPV
jgi:hypothetical protein